MNKEEILTRSRNENKDEGMSAAENKGRKIGSLVFCLVFIFITVFNLLNGQSNYAPAAMFWAFIAAESYPKYVFTKQKTYMVTTVAGAVASIASLGSFIITTLR